MLISQVQLVNFGIHKNSSFSFSAGLNAIVGRNGIGKSSIINAISIGLFNAVSNLGDFVTFGKETAQITINFNFNNKDYILTREFGKSSLCILSSNDQEIKGVKEVYAYLTVLFGIELKSYYLNVLRVKSSSITYPFIVESSKRKIIFDDILGISEYNVIWELLREPIKILDSNINELKNKLSYQKGKIDDIDKVKIELASINLDALQQEYNDFLFYKTLIEKKELLKDKTSKANVELNTLLNEAKRIDKQLSLLRDNICFTCLQPIEDNIELVSNRENTLSEMGSRIEALREYVTSTNKDINSIDIPYINDSTYSNLIRGREKKKLLQERLDSLKSTNELIAELDRAVSDIHVKRNKLTKIRDGFKRIPQILSERHTKSISFISSQILSSLMDKDVIVLFNTQYESSFEFDDIILNFNQLSDGQQILAALSIRLAIIKIFNDLGISILDEPTINLDTNSRQLLVENLKSVGFNQLFVVSHSDEFEAYVDNVIHL